jgi:CPA1 family monovalent cation:H+ antiporter
MIVGWTGMRGVVSLAAALALPLTVQNGSPFPGRDLILFLTFVVILATLVVQGLSLPHVIRWLKVEDDGSAEREERLARLKANQAALARLTELARADKMDDQIVHRLRAEYEDRISQLEESQHQESRESRGLFSEEYERLSLEALLVERQTILQLRNDRVINDEILRLIQHDIDLAEARVIPRRD